LILLSHVVELELHLPREDQQGAIKAALNVGGADLLKSTEKFRTLRTII